MEKIKHVLGLSGGKDSAALAILMKDRHPEIDMTYFFNDTGLELREVYEFKDKLQGILGKEIINVSYPGGFMALLDKYNGFLPSVSARWCTSGLKIKPTQKWLDGFIADGYTIYLYTGIRSDEPARGGMVGGKKYEGKIIPKFPFREHNIDIDGVYKILEDAGIGLPEYYKWRSRSGCFMCFFQRPIEWVRLKENHPDLFERARDMEKIKADGAKYTWASKRDLSYYDDPENVKAVKWRFQKKEYVEKEMRDSMSNSLLDIDAIVGIKMRDIAPDMQSSMEQEENLRECGDNIISCTR